jgi:hypothetical protein
MTHPVEPDDAQATETQDEPQQETREAAPPEGNAAGRADPPRRSEPPGGATATDRIGQVIEACRPRDQVPFLGPRGGTVVVVIGGAEAQGGKAGGVRRIAPVAPGEAPPGALGQAASQGSLAETGWCSAARRIREGARPRPLQRFGSSPAQHPRTGATRSTWPGAAAIASRQAAKRDPLPPGPDERPTPRLHAGEAPATHTRHRIAPSSVRHGKTRPMRLGCAEQHAGHGGEPRAQLVGAHGGRRGGTLRSDRFGGTPARSARGRADAP